MANETRSTNRPLNLTHVILALVAILGLALFILACRPSWSPDSQKVLYTYHDEDAKKSAVALFDRKTHQTRIVSEFTWEGSDAPMVEVQWTKDGQAALMVTTSEESQMYLISLPVGSTQIPHVYVFRKLADSEAVPMPPFPQIGNLLFFQAGAEFIRLNLDTGEVFRKDNKEREPEMFPGGSKLLYVDAIKKAASTANKENPEQKTPEQKSPEQKKEEIIAYEFGEVDQTDLSLHPTQTLSKDALLAKGIEELMGFVDVEPNTGDIAMLAGSHEISNDEYDRVAIIGKSGVKQVLNVSIAGKQPRLNGVEWSHDGRLVYVGALIPDEEKKQSEFAVLEVPLNGKALRIDKIEAAPTGEMGSDFLEAVQIALSPDGTLIAASTGDWNHARPERRGLFLLDVRKPERTVHFYPAPALPAPPK